MIQPYYYNFFTFQRVGEFYLTNGTEQGKGVASGAKVHYLFIRLILWDIFLPGDLLKMVPKKINNSLLLEFLGLMVNTNVGSGNKKSEEKGFRFG